MPSRSQGGALARPLSFEAFGVRLGLEVRAAELRPFATTMLPPGWQACPDDELVARFVLQEEEDGAYALTRDGQPLSGPVDGDVAVRMLDSRIRFEIAGAVRDRTFIHAGVVAVEDRTIVLPGPSFAGKSTLVAALIRQGATYLSDEYAVLDEQGLVHPYPRPLSIRARDARRGHQSVPYDQVRAEELGAATAEQALPVGLIAVLRFRPDAGWEPRPLTSAGGALALLSHAATARDSPATVLAQVRRAAERTIVIEGERGDAEVAAERLLELARTQR
jgi:hypothetical protein